MAAILVVEDRPINRRFVATLLRDQGHRVLEASDGDEAFELIRAESPDLILIDVLTPGTDGCQFVSNWLADPCLRQLRVVFRASFFLETEARELAGAFGAAFVEKPCSPEALCEGVSAALSAPPARPEPAQGSADRLLRQIARKVQGQLADLESLNAHLASGISQRNARLEVARSALDQEIKKRLWAEQGLTRANVRLQDQVMHDGLTGLHNRRYLEESLGREESRALRSGSPLGIMMIDIDHFKDFNDTLGHAAGDAVLRAVGGYLLTVARGEDIVCRYGGEEFVLVMAQTPHGTVWDRAGQLRAGVQGLVIEYDGRRVGPVTVSVGVGMFPDHGESGEAVLQVADAAMYRAKQSGRNCVVVGDKVSS